LITRGVKKFISVRSIDDIYQFSRSFFC